jgi:hypothetical protein
MRQKAIFIICLMIFFMLNNNIFVIPAQASICHNYGQDLICILNIKRSAKYYWQYRTEITINGVRQPMMIYDCRQKVKISQNGYKVAFTPNGFGNSICQTLNQ